MPLQPNFLRHLYRMIPGVERQAALEWRMIGSRKVEPDLWGHRIAPGPHCIDQHHIDPARHRIALAQRHIDSDQGQPDSALPGIVATPPRSNPEQCYLARSRRKDFGAAIHLWHFAQAQARSSLSCARDHFYAASSFL